MNAINKLKLSLSAVLFSFLGIACSDIDDNLVNYPVVAEVNTVYYIDSESGNDAVQPKPMSMGTMLRPERPMRRSSLSITKATRAM